MDRDEQTRIEMQAGRNALMRKGEHARLSIAVHNLVMMTSINPEVHYHLFGSKNDWFIRFQGYVEDQYVFFNEPAEGFPSDAFVAKMMLLGDNFQSMQQKPRRGNGNNTRR